LSYRKICHCLDRQRPVHPPSWELGIGPVVCHSERVLVCNIYSVQHILLTTIEYHLLPDGSAFVLNRPTHLSSNLSLVRPAMRAERSVRDHLIDASFSLTVVQSDELSVRAKMYGCSIFFDSYASHCHSPGVVFEWSSAGYKQTNSPLARKDNYAGLSFPLHYIVPCLYAVYVS
jgi:hypothetical protein